MMIEKWLDALFKIAKYRIKKEIQIVLEKLGEDGMGRSSTAGYSCIETGFKAINNEINNIFEKISELKYLRKNQVKILGLKCHNFITEQKEIIINQSKVTKFTPNDEYISTYYEDVKQFLELKIEVQQQFIEERHRRFAKEITRMLLTALIGGIVGGVISKYIFVK